MTGGRVLQATLALALARFNERRFADAEALYRRALAEAPNNADALNMLGLVFAEAGNPLQAIKYIDQALRLDPRGLRAERFCRFRSAPVCVGSADHGGFGAGAPRRRARPARVEPGRVF
jgi:tetratricopeptide (TPR) repeat protein